MGYGSPNEPIHITGYNRESTVKQTTPAQFNTQFTDRRTYAEALEELQFVTRTQALAERCILVGVNTAEAVRTLSLCEFCTMHLQMVLEGCNINGKPPLIRYYPQPISATARTH